MNKLGFGFLRLPMCNDQNVDFAALNPIVDEYLARGGTYCDTAYTYLNDKSEEAIRESLVKRYPRESFSLATKLPGYKVKSHEECYQLFEEQLQRCGVMYFDVYMLHWLNHKNYDLAEKYREFEFLQKLKFNGKAKKIGFSFHDTADLLDEILTAHPEVDYVLLQINYLDWESASIQSRCCYETAQKHNKSVIVMEPVKGGTLASVPAEAENILKKIDPNASVASHAIRFVQSLSSVEIVLSGMNTMVQLNDNMQDVTPMTEEERRILQQAAEIINSSIAVPCTGCGYCLKGCPRHISIPDYFKLYNEYVRKPDDGWKITPIYHAISQKNGKAFDCIMCFNCEKNCPQKLPITQFLKTIASTFK